MSRTALAFMSYVNFNDQYENGKMTQFCERLKTEVQMQTGEPFEIVHDRGSITWSQQWDERIYDSLDAITFLIPIITPAFFKSDSYRNDIECFLETEQEFGVNNLIIPIYYVNCLVLQDKSKREHDEIAQAVSSRKYADWRELRFESFATPKICKALAKLAQYIASLIEQPQVPVVIEQPHPSAAIQEKERRKHINLEDYLKGKGEVS